MLKAKQYDSFEELCIGIFDSARTHKTYYNFNSCYYPPLKPNCKEVTFPGKPKRYGWGDLYSKFPVVNMEVSKSPLVTLVGSQFNSTGAGSLFPHDGYFISAGELLDILQFIAIRTKLNVKSYDFRMLNDSGMVVVNSIKLI